MSHTHHKNVDAKAARQAGIVRSLIGLWHWLGAAWIPTERAFEHQKEIDAVRVRRHAIAALFTCAMLAGPTSVAELAIIPAGVATLLRVAWWWRTTGGLLLQTTTVYWCAALVWGLVGLAWSPDRAHGWDELGLVRWALLGLMLWPVIESRAALMAALIVGLHIGQTMQVTHAIGVLGDIEWLRWNRMPGRWSGWWDPVVGGTLLVGLLGMHLPAAAWGTGRWRVLGLVGSACAAGGIVATGTRGAWLAGMGLVCLTMIGLWWRSKRRLVLAGAGLAMVCVLGASAAGIGVLAGSGLTDRVEAAWTEINGAVRQGDYSTDTGARIGMALWALEALESHPVAGVGTGGYQSWVFENVLDAQGEPVETHAHAHNALLHIAATGGLVGVGLALLVFGSAVSSAMRFVPGDGPVGYRDGPAMALLGLGLVSAFDPIHLNAQTCALLVVLIVLRLPNRPRVR